MIGSNPAGLPFDLGKKIHNSGLKSHGRGDLGLNKYGSFFFLHAKVSLSND